MKNKVILSLGMICTFIGLSGMEQSSRLEQTPHTDARKIGILSWGSIVKDPRNLQIKESFTKSNLKLPIELLRLSAKGKPEQRITRIIDKESGVPINVWHATSRYTFLPDARKNLREREGSTLDNIFYIKTMLSNRRPDSNEEAIVDAHGNPIMDKNGRQWYIINKATKQLSADDISALAKWASEEKYDAVIWTGLGRTVGFDDRSKLEQLLETDNFTLYKTIEYINNGPSGKVEINPFQSRFELTPFEEFILNKYTL